MRLRDASVPTWDALVGVAVHLHALEHVVGRGLREVDAVAFARLRVAVAVGLDALGANAARRSGARRWPEAGEAHVADGRAARLGRDAETRPLAARPLLRITLPAAVECDGAADRRPLPVQGRGRRAGRNPDDLVAARADALAAAVRGVGVVVGRDDRLHGAARESSTATKSSRVNVAACSTLRRS